MDEVKCVVPVLITGFEVGGAEFAPHEFIESFPTKDPKAVERTINEWNALAPQGKKSLRGKVKLAAVGSTTDQRELSMLYIAGTVPA